MSDVIATWLRKRFINEKEWYGVEYEELNEAANKIEADAKLIQEMVDLLEGAESGFVSMSGPDLVWKRLRDETLSKAKSQQEGKTE